MYKNNRKGVTLACALSVSLLLAACGGGSDGGSAATGAGSAAPQAPQVAQGIFVDAPVVGMAYRSGDLSGVTDDSGHFSYVPGQPVTFSVGGVVIGTAAAQPVMTPVSLVPGAADETNDTVTNIGSFLQSLDSGGNLAQAIRIAPSSAQALAGRSLNFQQAPSAFAADAAVLAAVQAASPQGKLVPAVSAQAHLRGQSLCLYAGTWRLNGPSHVGYAFDVTVSEIDGSVSGTRILSDGSKYVVGGQVRQTASGWQISGSVTEKLAQNSFATVELFSGEFTDLNHVGGVYGTQVNATFKGGWNGSRLSGAQACGGSAASTVPAGAVGYADFHYNAAGMAPLQASVLDKGIGQSGVLTLGGNRITVVPQADGGYQWGSPVQYGMNFHQLLLAPDLPVASMVCLAANVNDGTDGLKSTDVLVAQNAIRITSAQQLAGQSFSQYWEDCRRDGLSSSAPVPQAYSSLSVDSAGKATLTLAGAAPVTLSADQFSALLAGTPTDQLGLPGSGSWFQAYGAATPDGVRYVLVEHGVQATDASRGYVGVWVR
ncbi:hypothetical protein BKK79_35450 [Cupriavidus sp. USMAA2-4]|uniref:hypothetical protein n=1 Tax=Cupriavidus sp. USMAA2-4 TaxID=876364 RepID=UPI0008A676D0|nr:hypothetical protein [Cupriavidus sp. USMAA2-4]AOY96802.1 hypothetical protein BKK79_35450 [Cupriavidus sp. USMAA2-4]